MKKNHLLVAAAITAIAISGCTTAGYNPKTGAITYSNRLFSKQIGVIAIKTPDGTDIKIEGVKSDADMLISATHDLVKTAAQLAAKAPVVP